MDIFIQNNNKDAIDIKFLLNTKVSIEKPHKKVRGPPQCHNCQHYGHTRNNCCHEPKCVKCDGNHPTNECSKDRHSPPKCALCTKEHTANFKGCPVYKATLKKQSQESVQPRALIPTPSPRPNMRQPQKFNYHTRRIISPTLYQLLF